MATAEEAATAALMAFVGAEVLKKFEADTVRDLSHDRYCFVILEKSDIRSIYATRWSSVDMLVMVQKFNRDNSLGRELAARLTLNMKIGESIGLRDPAVKEGGGFPSYGTLRAVIICDGRPAQQDLMKIFEHILRE